MDDRKWGFGGEGGIRTHEGVAPLPVFKTGPFNHSGTSPRMCKILIKRKYSTQGIPRGSSSHGGTSVGPSADVDVEKVKELRDSGMGSSAISKEMGIGRASIYRALGS